jgi:hypothetical protein
VFAWLGKLFGGRTAVQKNREKPVMRATMQKSAEIYDRIPLSDFISEQERGELSRQLYLDINSICSAANPVSTCRERLATAMLKMASYQVLVIPPPPQSDPTGLRLQPGITGELKEHLVRLSERNGDLRSEIRKRTESADFDVIWQVVQQSYWTAYWVVETFNAARLALDDRTEESDWYQPFMHAACANSEHIYRRDLEMPAAFSADLAQMAANAYSLYTDIILSGAPDPVSEWRDYHKDSDIPVPVFTVEGDVPANRPMS